MVAYEWSHAEISVKVDGEEVLRFESRVSGISVTWTANNVDLRWKDKYALAAESKDDSGEPTE